MRPQKLTFKGRKFESRSHYFFRYPAKFHPPVARHLIEEFSRPGETILDPFCGSGTLLVEGFALGRHCVGVDVDPLAGFISRVKSERYNTRDLMNTYQDLRKILEPHIRSKNELENLKFDDISRHSMKCLVRRHELWVPQIPNLTHWFRNYVTVDLARILHAIECLDASKKHIDFFRMAFASIIRAVSNADPVPVSGLEVTSHMRKRDALGRVIDPISTFLDRAQSLIRQCDAYYLDSSSKTKKPKVIVDDVFSFISREKNKYDIIITSPPYNSAVDYYRRHALESYWLRFHLSHEERVATKRRYIGRAKVTLADISLVNGVKLGPWATKMEREMRGESVERANAFRHYTVTMHRVFAEFTKILRPGGKVIIVAGDSSWHDVTISARHLFGEASKTHFQHEKTFWYPIRDRYMSYSRRNGANIDRDWVLVFRRR